MGPAVSLGDLDGRGGTGEAGQARFERRDFAPRPPSAGIDAGHSEFVGRARLEVLLLQDAVVRYADDVNVLMGSNSDSKA